MKWILIFEDESSTLNNILLDRDELSKSKMNFINYREHFETLLFYFLFELYFDLQSAKLLA